MLVKYNLSHSCDWANLIEDFDPLKNTWVVADLNAKLEVQQKLFKTFKVLPEESVLRAAELWKHMYSRVGSNSRVVSMTFAKVYLSEQLEKENENWLNVPGANKTLLEFIKQLFPFIIYPNSEDLISPWWQENPSSLVKWGRWYYYAKKYINNFLEKGWVLESWIPFILNNDYQDQIYWDRELFIDLGSQVTQTEAVLFKSLAEQQNCRVLIPKIIGTKKFTAIDRVYERFVELESSESEPNLNDCQFKRFSTSLGEIKDLSAQVRVWIESGVQPHQIGVLAPDIEYYWPVLSQYFEVENIPVNKKRVVRGQSFLPIMTWLSRLKIELGQVSTDDLELEVYADHDAPPPIAYSKFKKMYSLILDGKQIKRLKKISDRYSQGIDLNKSMHVDNFLAWALKHYNGNVKIKAFESILKTLLQESLSNTPLTAKSWIKMTEEIAAKIEITISEEQSHGIYVDSLKPMHNEQIEYLYILGFSESQMKRKGAIGLNTGEILKIESDLGFVLDLPDKQDLEFAGQWLFYSPFKQVKVSFADTNFMGEPDSPSMLWLKALKSKNEEVEKVDIPQISFWDFLQMQISKNPDAEKTKLEFIKRDLGELNLVNEPYKYLKSLSVSRLQRYSQCPFIFLAESIFKLEDPNVLDLDMDPMAKGQLFHKILQNLVTDPFKAEYSQKELEELIDKSRDETYLKLFDDRSWGRVRATMLGMCQRFLKFEAEWRQRFPQTKTFGKEVKLKAFWQQEKGEFVTDTNQGIEFRGSIDRVDKNSNGQAVVLDYKSSTGQAKNFSTWLESDQLQLSVYSYLIERGLTELEPLQVLGMGYYIIKSMERNKGLWCSEGDKELFDINKRSRNSMSKSELEAYWEKVKSRIQEIVADIESGNLQPKPKDVKSCDSCNWSRICRAPHLN